MPCSPTSHLRRRSVKRGAARLPRPNNSAKIPMRALQRTQPLLRRSSQPRGPRPRHHAPAAAAAGEAAMPQLTLLLLPLLITNNNNNNRTSGNSSSSLQPSTRKRWRRLMLTTRPSTRNTWLRPTRGSGRRLRRFTQSMREGCERGGNSSARRRALWMQHGPASSAPACGRPPPLPQLLQRRMLLLVVAAESLPFRPLLQAPLPPRPPDQRVRILTQPNKTPPLPLPRGT